MQSTHCHVGPLNRPELPGHSGEGALSLSRGVGAGPRGARGSDCPLSVHIPKSAKPALCDTWKPTNTAPCVMYRSIKPDRC
jgi:hypothetical protein